MILRTSDFLLTRFAQTLPGALKLLGDVETDFLRDQLEAVRLDRPVLIAGLARSGSTILLNLFSRLPEVGTHRYRDFPFVFVPYSWNFFQERLGTSEAPIERPHKDRITITRDSPEAFEEPMWMHFFPHVHDANANHRLTAEDNDPQFNEFYREHLRKILLVRGGRRRYVSKGNYNVARIEYLAQLLPDARFVVPIRHPVSHVNSLVRQHRLFTRYSEEDPRVPEYMRAAGHYEFGPQRVPINLDSDSPSRVLSAWSEGQDALGYAVMWRSVYSHVQSLMSTDSAIAERITIVRYEDFCANPPTTLERLFGFCELTEGLDALFTSLPDISAPARATGALTTAERQQVWEETAPIAASFGYYDSSW